MREAAAWRFRAKAVQDCPRRRVDPNHASRQQTRRVCDGVLGLRWNCSLQTAVRPDRELPYDKAVWERAGRACNIANAAVEELISPEALDLRIQLRVGRGSRPERHDPRVGT